MLQLPECINTLYAVRLRGKRQRFLPLAGGDPRNKRMRRAQTAIDLGGGRRVANHQRMVVAAPHRQCAGFSGALLGKQGLEFREFERRANNPEESPLCIANGARNHQHLMAGNPRDHASEKTSPSPATSRALMKYGRSSSWS